MCVCEIQGYFAMCVCEIQGYLAMFPIPVTRTFRSLLLGVSDPCY